MTKKPLLHLLFFEAEELYAVRAEVKTVRGILGPCETTSVCTIVFISLCKQYARRFDIYHCTLSYYVAQISGFKYYLLRIT